MRISDWSSVVCSSDLLGSAVWLQGLGKPQRPSQRGSQFALAHGGLPADDGGHRPAGHAHAGERRPAAFRFQPAFLDCLFPLQVDQREIGIIAERDPARSEEHTSELQSLMRISYAVFCLKQKKHTSVQKMLK